MAAVESFRFLGTTTYHFDSIATKAQQRLYFPLQIKQFNLPQESLKQFYSAIIESVLCSFITVWVGSATKSDIRRLRFVCVCVCGCKDDLGSWKIQFVQYKNHCTYGMSHKTWKPKVCVCVHCLRQGHIYNVYLFVLSYHVMYFDFI